jgi:hypothetical protein
VDSDSLLALLERAEPATAVGLLSVHIGQELVSSAVFAYRRGGGWSVIGSDQGAYVDDRTDGTHWWSPRSNRPRWTAHPGPTFHSPDLRDMLLPRHRTDLWPTPLARRAGEPARYRLGTPHPVTYVPLRRPAWAACVIGSEPSGTSLREWVVVVDAATGIVLADVWNGGRRHFDALVLDAPLHGALFFWDERPDERQ